MGWLEQIGDHVYENREGMVFDLVFALVWVTLASLFVSLVNGPPWARYLLFAAGIPAYFGFVYSLKLARTMDDEE